MTDTITAAGWHTGRPRRRRSWHRGATAGEKRRRSGYNVRSRPRSEPRRRDVDADAERKRLSERARFADQLDRELQLGCRIEAMGRRQLGDAARVFLRYQLYRRLGFVRIADYARERLGVSGRYVQEAAWMAERLDALPAVSTAFDRSEISWTQARLICGRATADDAHRWLALARHHTVEELGRIADATAPPRDVPAAPDPDSREIDGEPAVHWRLACPARVRALWRRARELASRMAGAPLADWQAAEIIAAEGFSGRPPDVVIADRALVASMHLARRLRRMSRDNVAPDRAASGVAGRSDDVTRRCLRDTDATAVPPQHGADATPLPLLTPAGEQLDYRARLLRTCHRQTAAALPPTPANPFALDAQLLFAMETIRKSEPNMGRLLRVMIDRRFYRSLGFRSVDAYVRERLGISTRKAWALAKLDRATSRSEEFAQAYEDGSLSWARALTLLPVLERTNAQAWIARAQAVTVRRLSDDVNAVLEARDACGDAVPLDPPPLGERATQPAGAVQTRAHDADTTRPRLEVCDVEVRITAPVSVIAFLRDTLDVFWDPGAPRWTGFERLLQHVIGYWEGLPRHRDPIFARDGWRCTVPGCSSRRTLHDHHLVFRSRGGGNARTNRTPICAAHHLHGVHAGTIHATGDAPDAIRWQLGVRPGAPPLLRYLGDQLCPDDDATAIAGRARCVR